MEELLGRYLSKTLQIRPWIKALSGTQQMKCQSAARDMPKAAAAANCPSPDVFWHQNISLWQKYVYNWEGLEGFTVYLVFSVMVAHRASGLSTATDSHGHQCGSCIPMINTRGPIMTDRRLAEELRARMHSTHASAMG